MGPALTTGPALVRRRGAGVGGWPHTCSCVSGSSLSPALGTHPRAARLEAQTPETLLSGACAPSAVSSLPACGTSEFMSLLSLLRSLGSRGLWPQTRNTHLQGHTATSGSWGALLPKARAWLEMGGRGPAAGAGRVAGSGRVPRGCPGGQPLLTSVWGRQSPGSQARDQSR